jgi:hypothetical protein
MSEAHPLQLARRPKRVERPDPGSRSRLEQGRIDPELRIGSGLRAAAHRAPVEGPPDVGRRAEIGPQKADSLSARGRGSESQSGNILFNFVTIILY